MSKNPGRKIAHRRSGSTEEPAHASRQAGSQVGGQREHRSGDGLRSAVPGQKIIRGDPPGLDHELPEQRQNHVTATKHQCPRAVERFRNGDKSSLTVRQQR